MGSGLFDSPCGDVVNHIPRYVGQPKVAAAVAVREFRMIDSQQIKDRGMNVVDVYPFAKPL
jgi:hypothetical protein